MKKILLSLAAVAAFTFNSNAQAPEGFKYQAVVRNASSVILTNQAVGLRMTIQQGTIGGTTVYSETFSTTTNAYGLVNIEIGTGTVLSGNLASINWANGPYFIETAVDNTGGTAYVVMGTSQLMSVPYALFAKTATNVINDAVNDADSNPTNEIQSLSLVGQNLTISGGNTVVLPSGSGTTLDGAYDQGGPGLGRTITADAGPVQINGSGTNTAALGIQFTGTGNSINAANTNAANTFSTVQAVTNSSTANNSAIFGQSTGAARAVAGEVTATSTADAAVRGNNLRTTGGMGVEGVGFNGVSGQTNYRAGYGVFGQNFDLVGPITENSVGVGGVGYIGVLGQSSDPVNGGGIGSLDNIIALGDLVVSGTKNFRIDYPKDPENKYLNHFSIESNEVLNIYRGTVAFDSNGVAIVQLPEWFDDVNKNPSYQLTPIGGYAPIYIAEKLKDGRFVIAGGTIGMEVSWAVYAERNDPYLQQHPEARQVVEDKSDREAGKYLRPDLYNQPDEKAIIKAPAKK